jgi:predicted dehydrogenase
LVEGMGDLLRFGFVGLGMATRSFHLPAVKGVEGVELAGGSDPSDDQRSSWERETGSPAYGDLEALLVAERPDVVVVATPPDSHAELCIQALEAGAHVFCEKPFVSTVAEADRVIGAAAAAGRQIAVNHEFREKPIFRAVRERIESGEVGRLAFCQIWQLMDLPPWEEPVAWRRQMPNRTLFEGGVHLVDLLLTLFGESPLAVYARRSSGVEEHEADAVHLVTLEFPGGRLGQITIDRLCRAGTRYVEVRADCEEASLRASHGGRAQIQIGKKRAERTGIRLELGAGGLAWEERGLARKVLARNPRQAMTYGTTELLKQIAPAFRENREPPSSAAEAREVLAVIEAAYESARTGRRIELSAAAAAPAAA